MRIKTKMKNNRKNRKLKFIKIKNSLRLGYNTFYCSEKVSNDLDWNNEEYWNRLISIAKKALYKNYRLTNLNKVVIESSRFDGDNFVKNLTTNRIALSLK